MTVCQERGAEAVLTIRTEYGLSEEAFYEILDTDDDHPAYDAYFALLSKWYNEMLHS